MPDQKLPSGTTPPTLAAALRYLARGWSVVPTAPGDKRPRLDSWKEYQQRPPTEAEVRSWWARWPDSGVAVVTGRVSGVVVVDVDDAAGREALGKHPHGPTLTAVTGGGGKHLYFKHPGGTVPGAVRFLPGVDCRGDGNCVVAPPSLHRSGSRYRWDDPAAGTAELPAGILSLILGGGAAPAAGDWSGVIPDGERDVRLTRLAGKLLRAGMTAAEALPVLAHINASYCHPPLGDAQVRKIVDSIAAREAARAGGAPGAPAFTVLAQREMLRKFGEDETRWTVEEWLPEASCGLLVAPPGNYKTWILTALVYAVATGRPFLGRYTVHTPGAVLIIQQEDPWWMLESRLSRMFAQEPPSSGGPAENPHYEVDCRYTAELDGMPAYWYTDRQLSFTDRASMAGLEREIAARSPKLVIVDPLYTAADTRDYMAEGAQKMTQLKLMRDRYGCSFVVAHHTTVAGSSSEDRSSIWGSQFLNAWLEFGWRMPKGTERGNVMIRHFKSCSDPRRIRLKFRITDWNFSTEVDDSYTPPTAERVEDILLNDETASIRQMARIIGCSAPAVVKALQKLGLEKHGGGPHGRRGRE